MAEKKKETAARGAAKKAANRKKTPSQSSRTDVAASMSGAPQATAKKAVARKGAGAKGAAKKADARRHASPEERYRLIQEEAYLRAEKEGFRRDPANYWLVAEAEVDARLAKSH